MTDAGVTTRRPRPVIPARAVAGAARSLAMREGLSSRLPRILPVCGSAAWVAAPRVGLRGSWRGP